MKLSPTFHVAMTILLASTQAAAASTKDVDDIVIRTLDDMSVKISELEAKIKTFEDARRASTVRGLQGNSRGNGPPADLFIDNPGLPGLAHRVAALEACMSYDEVKDQ